MLRFFISAEPLRGGGDAEYAEENKPRSCGALPGGGEVVLAPTFQDQEFTREIIGSAIQVHKYLETVSELNFSHF